MINIRFAGGSFRSDVDLDCSQGSVQRPSDSGGSPACPRHSTSPPLINEPVLARDRHGRYFFPGAQPRGSTRVNPGKIGGHPSAVSGRGGEHSVLIARPDHADRITERPSRRRPAELSRPRHSQRLGRRTAPLLARSGASSCLASHCGILLRDRRMPITGRRLGCVDDTCCEHSLAVARTWYHSPDENAVLGTSRFRVGVVRNVRIEPVSAVLIRRVGK